MPAPRYTASAHAPKSQVAGPIARGKHDGDKEPGLAEHAAVAMHQEPVLDIDLADLDGRPARGEMVPSGLAPLSEIVGSGFGVRLVFRMLSRHLGFPSKHKQGVG
jgi:hypothetical protein